MSGCGVQLWNLGSDDVIHDTSGNALVDILVTASDCHADAMSKLAGVDGTVGSGGWFDRLGEQGYLR